MSQYRIVWPDDVLDEDGSAGETALEPVILQFRVTASRARFQPMDIISRARLLFENRSCRSCGYPVVLPIELDDAQLNRNRQAIPGTASLVGFRCEGCRAEWSV
jgi:hypothetical protein